GPGHVLSGLVAECTDTPVVALDAGGSSLRGLLHAVGAAFVLGAPVNHAALFAGRFTRPFDLTWQPRFFANPCERAPKPSGMDHDSKSAKVHENPSRSTIPHAPTSSPLDWFAVACTTADPVVAHRPDSQTRPALDLVRRLVAERTELPPSAVKDDSRLLS